MIDLDLEAMDCEIECISGGCDDEIEVELLDEIRAMVDEEAI